MQEFAAYLDKGWSESQKHWANMPVPDSLQTLDKELKLLKIWLTSLDIPDDEKKRLVDLTPDPDDLFDPLKEAIGALHWHHLLEEPEAGTVRLQP